jgi:hypothetical protein
MSKKKNVNYEKLANEMMDEIFSTVKELVEEYEAKGLEVQGLVNFIALDKDGDCVAGRWEAKLEDKEMFDLINEEVIDHLEQKELEGYEDFSEEECDGHCSSCDDKDCEFFEGEDFDDSDDDNCGFNF